MFFMLLTSTPLRNINCPAPAAWSVLPRRLAAFLLRYPTRATGKAGFSALDLCGPLQRSSFYGPLGRLTLSAAGS